MVLCPVNRAGHSVNGNTADVVHLDVAKAFDSVNHRLLLTKSESFGLTERTYRAQVAWKWSLNLDLPFNSTKYNSSLQLSFATGIPGHKHC